MTVEELIEALKALPKDAQRRPVVIPIEEGYQTRAELDVDYVDYDLRVVALRY